MRTTLPPHPQRPLVEAMESRLLYSADIAPAAFIGSTGPGLDTSHQRLADTTATSNQAATPGTEIVFVDARVPDQGALLTDLAEQAKQGRAIEVVFISADEDGIARITQTLADRHDVSAVHLISHGQTGSVQLGNTLLDENTLLGRAHDVASWGQALTTDADLLIYGCDVGAQPQGLALVQGLAALTGADVAASDDLTGQASQGGDWTLEVQSGHIDAQLAPSAQGQSLFSGVLAAEPIGKGIAVWSTSGSSTPQVSVWDGTTTGTSTATASAGQWTVMTTAAAPTRDEYLAVGVSANGTITGEVIRGTTGTLIPLTLGTGTPANRQGFGVAYEQTSGDAMLVWNDGTNLKYSVFNGSTWTAAATIASYTGAAPQHMQLASQPGGDGMALVISDANADDHALVWNGSAWGNEVVLDTSGTTAAEQTSIAVAYEAKSGHVMVGYAKAGDANVYFRIFDGTAWGAETAAGNYLEAATPQWLTLASDPTSNRIAMGLVSNSSTQTFTSFSVWNDGGSQAWGSRTTVVPRTTTTNSPTVAVGFESKSGDLLAVYGTSSTTNVSYQTWTHAGGWSSIGTGPATGGTVGALRLDTDPTTNNIMLGYQTTAGRLSYADWTGSAWATPVLATTNTGSTLTPAFSWVFQPHIAGNTANTLWLGSSQANTGWTGVNGNTATEVLALENPNLHYGSTTTGTFSHAFDASAFGATGLDDIAWVSRDVVLTSGITAHRGDILFSVPSTTTLSSANSISAARNDVVIFRPTVAGDYSAGTFTKVFTVNNTLLGTLGLGSGASVRGLALVEQAVTINGTALTAGTILFTYGNGSTAATDILRYNVMTDLAASVLVSGSDNNVGIGSSITGLEVVTGTVKTGSNATLSAGTLLLTLAQADSQVSNSYLSVAATDVFTLNFYNVSGTTYALANLLVQGSDVGVTSGYLDGLALTLDAAPVIDSNGGGANAAISVSENTSAAVTTVAAHDIDEYATLQYSISGGADAAQFTINSSTGALRFIGTPDFEAPKDSNKNNIYEVIVKASDGTYDDTQTLLVTVTNVNEVPVIVSGGGGATATVVVADQTTTAMTVHANDPDLGDVLTYTIVGGADQALFHINSVTGELSFNSMVDYYNPQDSDLDNIYQVTVRATDASNAQDQQALNIVVQPSNFPPGITSDGGGATATITVNEFHTAVTTVQASDPEGTQITYGISGGADQARFTIDAATGELKFVSPPDTTAPGDVGSINSYEVQVSASDGPLTTYQTLTVQIQPYTRPVNTVPVATTATEDTAQALSGLGVTDPDAGSGAITVTLNVQHGTLSVRTDAAGGLDSTGVQYSSDLRTATLTGSVSAINATLASSQGVVYLADVNYSGHDDLTMVTEDGVNTGSAPPLTASSTGSITVTPANDAPTAVIQQTGYTATEQTDLALHNTGLHITDVDAGTATVRVDLIVGQGILTVTAGTTGVTIGNSGTQAISLTGTVDQINDLLDGNHGGTLVYRNNSDTPSATPDSLIFSVDDLGNTGAGGAFSHTAIVDIAVTAVNDVPAAGNDTTTVNEDAVLNGTSVLANDTDADGDALTATLVSSTSHGTLVFNANGTYTYTPDADFNGTDTFTYTANDGTVDSSIATVTITVTAVNDAPVASNDTATTNEDTVLNGSSVLANDSDVDGNALTATLVSSTSHGTLVFNADGTYTYTPGANFNGTDTFTYTANDGTTNSSTATVTITITAVNDAPVAGNDTAAVNEDAVLSGTSVLANDTDVEGSALTATLVSSTSHGTLVFNADGTYSYTPGANFNGTDTFTYTANDGSLNTNTATVTITVAAVNDAPVAGNDTAAVNEDTVLNGSSVLANDTDVDSANLTATLVSSTGHGTLVFNADGSYTYTPGANFNGTDTFTYQASDGALVSTTATVTITVAAVNDAPDITANSLTINQGGTAEPMLTVIDVDNAPADLTLSATGIVGGHFARADTGNTVTQFTLADVQAHQIVFVHDGSPQVPAYAISASDGTAISGTSAVQAAFTPTPPPPVIVAPTTAPPPPPPPAPAPEKEASTEQPADQAAAPTASGSAAMAEAAAPLPAGLSFELDLDNTAPPGAGFTLPPVANRYGVDLTAKVINVAASTATSDEAFGYSWLKALATTSADTQNLRSSLEALREQLKGDNTGHRNLVASSIAVSTGLSVGYVIWLVRGGALIGSMLSAMPAWQMIDPLPVLARGRGGRQDDFGDDDASVEHIFDDDDAPAQPHTPPPMPPAPAPTVEGGVP